MLQLFDKEQCSYLIKSNERRSSRESEIFTACDGRASAQSCVTFLAMVESIISSLGRGVRDGRGREQPTSLPAAAAIDDRPRSSFLRRSTTLCPPFAVSIVGYAINHLMNFYLLRAGVGNAAQPP